MPVLEIVGWLGSALLVLSLAQTRVVRFRVLNLVACVVLVGYNAVIGVWPMAAVNLVLTGINAWVLAGLLRRRHDARTYEAVPVGVAEPFLARLLARHDDDLRAIDPGLPADPLAAADHAFLVTTGDDVVGVVLSADGGRPDEQRVVLDYVLPPYRDFTPGEFVFRPDGPFAALGTRRVVVERPVPASARYLAAVGFRPDGDRQVLDLAAR